jgi:hypothetical protein
MIEQFLSAHQHAGSTKTAVDSVVIEERFLQRMKLLPLSQTLNRENFLAVNLWDENKAGIHRLSIHQNSAGTAFAYLAAPLCTRQSQLVAQKVEKRHVRTNIKLVPLAVDRCSDENTFHELHPDLY